MENFIAFVCENYEMIILVAACVLDLILFLLGVFIRKKLPVLQAVIDKLPEFIRNAERIYGPGHGAEKKLWVLNCAYRFYCHFSKCDPGLKSEEMNMVSLALEDILDTPQKKGK